MKHYNEECIGWYNFGVAHEVIAIMVIDGLYYALENWVCLWAETLSGKKCTTSLQSFWIVTFKAMYAKLYLKHAWLSSLAYLLKRATYPITFSCVLKFNA